MTPEEIELMKADMKREKDEFGRWNWFALIEKLAGGDVTKFDAVQKQPTILCFNLLSYWQEKEKKIAKMQEEANRNRQQIK